jgi:lipoate-protein ligase A
LDEALARSASSAATLRLWRNRRCVVLGRFQVARAEVDHSACRALGVPVYRRFTGGGTVYHDAGNLNVSLVLLRGDPLLAGAGRQSLRGLFRLVLEPLADVVRSLGLDAGVDRDLRVGGRKLGGVAAWQGASAVLVHATLLVDAELDVLERVLAGPGASHDPRWLRTRSRRAAEVTSLAREGVPRGALDRVDRTVAAAFAAFEVREASAAGRPVRVPVLEEPTGCEREAMLTLLDSRYSTPTWHLTGIHEGVVGRARAAA